MDDRSVECSQCKKPVKVVYKEIVDKSVIRTEMCADCPLLEERLHGASTANAESIEGVKAGLCCNNCRTTLESVKTGNALGCSECYVVFSDLLVSELIASNSLPSRMIKSLTVKKNQPLHVGKFLDKPLTFATSERLKELNEALAEALKKENYEHAASLRDQIKALKEKSDEGKS